MSTSLSNTRRRDVGTVLPFFQGAENLTKAVAEECSKLNLKWNDRSEEANVATTEVQYEFPDNLKFTTKVSHSIVLLILIIENTAQY